MREFNLLFDESGDAECYYKLNEDKKYFIHRDISRFDLKKSTVYSLLVKNPLFVEQSETKTAISNLAKILTTFLKKYNISKNKLILAVGVGNEGMTADALGAKTLQYLDISEHFHKAGIKLSHKGRLSAIAGNVSGVTGIDSFDIVKGVVDRIKPDIVIAIDTLSSKKVDRIQHVIQTSDGGITPGSGINNAKQELSPQTLGIPVISVGVPLVIYAKNLIIDSLKEKAIFKASDIENRIGEMILTIKDIDIVVDSFAKCIGFAINEAVHRTKLFF